MCQIGIDTSLTSDLHVALIPLSIALVTARQYMWSLDDAVHRTVYFDVGNACGGMPPGFFDAKPKVPKVHT